MVDRDPGAEDLPHPPFRAVVCDSDELGATALRQAAERAGLEVLPEAANAVEALRLVDLFEPDAVIIVNELIGMTGLEALIDLQGRPERPEVVLLTSRPELEHEALEHGAVATAPRGDLPALEVAIDKLLELLITGNRRAGDDRRAGQDRRQHQDWSKVTRERRSGEDRRKGPRRTD
jgi:CheY-like chemotaxis protein